MFCRHCGAPIHFVREAGGWLHASPLAFLRVSHSEATDIHANPPHKDEVLHRQTFLHPAQPEHGRTDRLGYLKAAY